MYKLPVWNTIGETYSFIWTARGDWLNYAAVPFVALGLLSAVFFLTIQSAIGVDLLGIGVTLTPDQARQLEVRQFLNIGGLLWVGGLAVVLIYYFIYVVFSVAWHRRYLLGAEKSALKEMFVWKRRHWRFLGRMLLLAVLLLIAGLLLGLASGAILGFVLPRSIANIPILGFLIGFTLALLPALIVTLAACSVATTFPAAAIEDDEISFSKAGELAKGNIWRIWITFLIGLFIPLGIFQFILESIFLEVLPPEMWLPSIGLTIVVMVVLQAVNFLGVALGVSMLSIMYRRLRDNVPLESGAST